MPPCRWSLPIKTNAPYGHQPHPIKASDAPPQPHNDRHHHQRQVESIPSQQRHHVQRQVGDAAGDFEVGGVDYARRGEVLTVFADTLVERRQCIART